MIKTLVAAAAVGVAAAAPAARDPAYNATELAEIFINLGELAHNPENVNCNRYTSLFAPNGVLHSPGIPDAYGQPSINLACGESHKSVNPLISFQELNIQILNYKGQPRTAFRWTINGVRTKDGYLVAAPAISALFQDVNGSILDAYSFYDTSLIDGDGTPTPVPKQARDIANQFVRFGSVEPVPVGLQCKAFGAMFDANNGTWHLPGVPDYYGADDITKACNTMIAPWQVIVPSIQTIIPVNTWNDYHKIAIRHTVAGESKSQKGVVIPAITILYMDQHYQITDAWSFHEEDLWPTM